MTNKMLVERETWAIGIQAGLTRRLHYRKVTHIKANSTLVVKLRWVYLLFGLGICLVTRQSASGDYDSAGFWYRSDGTSAAFGQTVKG